MLITVTIAACEVVSKPDYLHAGKFAPKIMDRALLIVRQLHRTAIRQIDRCKVGLPVVSAYGDEMVALPFSFKQLNDYLEAGDALASASEHSR